MKYVAQSLTLGLAVLAASTASPRAADWAVGSGGARDFGSIKDYRNAAVPVPAPTPSPMSSKDWYVRGDIGYDLATVADITATGGITAQSGDQLNGFTFGSVGFGRYITPSLRAEFSVEFRPKKVVTSGTQTYSKTTVAVNAPVAPAVNPTQDTITYNVSQQDESRTVDHTAFANLYYDFHNSSRFTPYVGAGIGIDSKRFKRVTSQSVTCNQVSVDTVTLTSTTSTGTCPASPYAAVAGGGPATYTDDKWTQNLGFAAALMVGAAYEVMPGVQWDAGYRLLWAGATVSLDAKSFDGVTRVNISDRLDHELRTGVRIDLN
jgi:opacity protein-like surface antigen